MTIDIASTSWGPFTATGTGGTYNSWQRDGIPLVNRTQILNPEFTFTDDFEGSMPSFWGVGTNVRYGVAASQDPSYTGGNVLAFDYTGTSPNSIAEQPFNVSNCLQVEISYRKFIPANYDQPITGSNNKVLVLRSDGSGAISTSNHAFSIECFARTNNIEGSVPYLQMGGQGINFDFSGWFSASPNDATQKRIYVDGTAGYWQEEAIYYVLPENGEEFGTLELWIDDELVISSDLNLDISSGAGGVPTSQQIIYNPTNNYINYGYLMGHANAGFLEATTFYIDNFSFKSRSTSVGATT